MTTKTIRPTGSTLIRCLFVVQKREVVAHAVIEVMSAMADVDYMAANPQGRETPRVAQTTHAIPTALELGGQSPYANKRPH